MQQPIRYYITKSGEEPTVRSVRVARGVAMPEMRDDTPAPHVTEGTSPVGESAAPQEGVKRLVRGAMRKRRRSQ